MAIIINDNYQNNSPKSLDAKYTKFSGGVSVAYSSVAEANSTILAAYRSVGLTVLINTGGGNTEYWYKNGIGDGDLVVKDLGYVLAENGLTKTGDTVRLGGPLTANTGIATSSFQLTFTSNTSTTPLAVINSSTGGGITVSTASGTSVIGTSSTGSGGSFTSTSGIGVVGGSNGTFGVDAYRSTATNNAIVSSARVRSVIAGTPLAGFGTRLDFHATTNGGSANLGSIAYRWTDPANATRSAEMVIEIANGGSVQDILTVSNTGVFRLVQGLIEYADDAAAATGGIPINGLYKTGSVVKIRVS